MNAKILVLLMLFNHYLLLDQPTRVNQIEHPRIAFNIPGSAVQQMRAGELGGGLNCNLDAQLRDKPKKGIKLKLGGHFTYDNNLTFPIRVQTRKTDANGKAAFIFNEDLEAILDLLDELDELEDYALWGKFEGEFRGAKPLSGYSLICRAVGDLRILR